jgi:uncharacterized protein YyaL (SSP411 family)
MLKGFVDAYKAFGESHYLAVALQNASFIIENLWSSEGNLFRTYKNGKATINAYLEDYAHVIGAFIALYEATLDEDWLRNAKQLTDYCFDYFYDEHAQFFSFTSKSDADLIAPHFEVEDNVIPAANSVMADNLYRLSLYYNNTYYDAIARQMVQIMVPTIDFPSAFSNWLNVCLYYSGKQQELAVCGKEALNYLPRLNALYLPNISIAGSTEATQLPFLKNRFTENETLFYLCQNKTCALPTSNFEGLLSDLFL